MENSGSKRRNLMLTIAALGVVFGDIGTSPLYALKECFSATHGIALQSANVLGVLSLVLWALVVVVGVKYICYVLHADNEGEGGVFALMALILRGKREEGKKFPRRFVVLLGLFGGALLYGDSVITPAISVLSAVEGLNVGTAFFEPYVIPLTIGILCSLFLLQSRGTSGIGTIFGPVMLVWFLVLGLLGVRGILLEPRVLAAVNPWFAVEFLLANRGLGFLVLGAVFLAITGGEALYADLGHFGRAPITRAWFWWVLPGLVLNYFGQGALLLSNPAAIDHPFYHLAPDAFRPVLILLATAATIVASQAMISGAFSLSFQAIQLDYLPRLQVKHTSAESIGQIYVPLVNRVVWFTTIALVLGFQSSGNMAAAYGVAVATTMVITTILMYFVATHIWHWRSAAALLITVLLLLVDCSFLVANLAKIVQGGWFPLIFGTAVLVFMATWHRGRELLAVRMSEVLVPFDSFVDQLPEAAPVRIHGSAVYMVRSLKNTPLALFHNVTRHHILHEHVFLVKVVTERRPYVPQLERCSVVRLPNGIWGIILRFGFNDVPNVPRALALLPEQGVSIDLDRTTYYLGRETVLSTARPGMARWRERLFAFLARNAQTATTFFSLPPQQVVEIGLQIDI